MFQEKYHGGREKPVRWKRSRLASLFPFITTRKLMMAPKDDRRQTLRAQRAAAPAGGLPLLRRVESLPVRDKHIFVPETRYFHTRGKVVSSRWPGPAHASGASYNFPAN
jgi:hypothetical protein